MAKQAGDYFIEGTFDDLTFYKMDGVYYVRMKSSLTGKKFWEHKAFERSRESCKRFCEGNKLASKVYRQLEKEKRQYKLFCFLKKRAILLLQEGKSLADAELILNEYLAEFGYMEMEIPREKGEEKEGNNNRLTGKTNKPWILQAKKIGSVKTQTLFSPLQLAHRKSVEFEFPPDP